MGAARVFEPESTYAEAFWETVVLSNEMSEFMWMTCVDFILPHAAGVLVKKNSVKWAMLVDDFYKRTDESPNTKLPDAIRHGDLKTKVAFFLRAKLLAMKTIRGASFDQESLEELREAMNYIPEYAFFAAATFVQEVNNLSGEIDE